MTKPATKTSPAPVGSSASTVIPGTSASSAVRPSTAYAPSGPIVTTASGTFCASARAAALGQSVRVYRMASPAFGRKASQCSRSGRSPRSQRPLSSHPTSAKIRDPRRAASAIHGSVRPGPSEATAARVRGGHCGNGPGAAGGGASWPCETIVRSPS